MRLLFALLKLVPVYFEFVAERIYAELSNQLWGLFGPAAVTPPNGAVEATDVVNVPFAVGGSTLPNHLLSAGVSIALYRAWQHQPADAMLG